MKNLSKIKIIEEGLDGVEMNKIIGGDIGCNTYSCPELYTVEWCALYRDCSWQYSFCDETAYETCSYDYSIAVPTSMLFKMS